MRWKKGNRWRSSGGELRYRKWRKMVCELNKRKIGLSSHYVCVKCRKKWKTTRALHAHHIYSWKKFPNRRYTMKNGVLLCKRCHYSFHNKYKFDAVENPTLISEWLGDKSNKYVKEYLNENK